MADDNLMNEFLADTQGHLENIEEDTLRLEKNPTDEELIGDVFRRVHSIKGNAGIMGLAEIYSYGQEFESFLDGVRERKIATTAEIEKVFRYLDGLKAQIMRLKGEEVEKYQETAGSSGLEPDLAEESDLEDTDDDTPGYSQPASYGAEMASAPTISIEARQAELEARKRHIYDGGGPVTVLTFQIGPEIYGIDIMKVKEIITYERVTRVPNTKWFVDGVMNLRDQVIPVFDLCKKLKIKTDPGQAGRERSIIVVEISKVITGLAVDDVTGIKVFEQERITPPENFKGKISIDYLLGVGQLEESAVIILDALDICDPAEILY